MWTNNSFYNPLNVVSRYAKNNNTETHVAVFEFVNSNKKRNSFRS
jgi:hypothetical protein